MLPTLCPAVRQHWSMSPSKSRIGRIALKRGMDTRSAQRDSPGEKTVVGHKSHHLAFVPARMFVGGSADHPHRLIRPLGAIERSDLCVAHVGPVTLRW
jgi:hypothetical protein